ELQQQVGFFPGPSLDGCVITRPACEAIQDGGAAGIPILAGATRDEGTLLAPLFAVTEEVGRATIMGLATSVGRDDGAEYLEFLTDQMASDDVEFDDVVAQMTRTWFDVFRASALRVAATASQHGAGGWVYNFEVPTDHPLGVTHYADVPFTFNWMEAGHPRLFVHPATDAHRELARLWSSTMVAFATRGSPNGQGLPQWPQYQPDSFSCLRVTAQPEIVDNPDGDDMLRLYKVLSSD
ncbi:MAG: carboxylesterase family protein, partial [Pseudomonadota bacterium]